MLPGRYRLTEAAGGDAWQVEMPLLKTLSPAMMETAALFEVLREYIAGNFTEGIRLGLMISISKEFR
jgi:hypothetical protein